MNEKDTSEHSKTDWQKLEAMTDEDIDYLDIPPLGDDFFVRAKLWSPQQPQMKRLILLLLIAVFLSACNSSNAPTSTPSLQESLLRQIDAAQTQWQAQEIKSYHVEVLAVRGTWHAQSHQITVRDGQIVSESASCTPAPAEMGQCEVEPFDAQDYTIPALFALAKVRAGQAQYVRLTFDPSFGFPNLLSCGDPEIVDGGEVWRVVAFEALE